MVSFPCGVTLCRYKSIRIGIPAAVPILNVDIATLLLSCQVSIACVPNVVSEDGVVSNENNATGHGDLTRVSVGFGIVSIDVRVIDSYDEVGFPSLWICDVVDVEA